jgi:hypothetical protein
MIGRSRLFVLAPLALASAALVARESSRSEQRTPPEPGPIHDVAPPSALIALASPGSWRVLEDACALELSGCAIGARAQRPVRGSALIDPEGNLAQLDLWTELTAAEAQALFGVRTASGIELHAEPGPSIAAAVPGVRRADLRAGVACRGIQGQIALRAFWIPAGPGLLRLQLEARLESPAARRSSLLDVLAEAPRSPTLALDLALTRS